MKNQKQFVDFRGSATLGDKKLCTEDPGFSHAPGEHRPLGMDIDKNLNTVQIIRFLALLSSVFLPLSLSLSPSLCHFLVSLLHVLSLNGACVLGVRIDCYGPLWRMSI